MNKTEQLPVGKNQPKLPPKIHRYGTMDEAIKWLDSDDDDVDFFHVVAPKGSKLNLPKVLYAWLKDVYAKSGWVAVLICLVVICAIVFAVILFLPPNVQAALYNLVKGN